MMALFWLAVEVARSWSLWKQHRAEWTVWEGPLRPQARAESVSHLAGGVNPAPVSLLTSKHQTSPGRNSAWELHWDTQLYRKCTVQALIQIGNSEKLWIPLVI